MSLYIKHRPADFSEIVGNKNTINTLRTAINKKSPPHAYLFIGPPGTGKTTLARISAQKLNCANMDIMELNAANFRGIDTSREIIRQMRLAALGGGARAWILDESASLTKDAQTALLKALEDAPPHVYFLLATTDPQKLLPTIRNRCMIFTLQYLSEDKIFCLLEGVIEKENKNVSDEAIEQIAQRCQGCPRTALILLDGIIDLPEKDMLKSVRRITGIERTTLDLCQCLINGSRWKPIASTLKALTDQEPEQVRMAVLNYCKTVLLNDGERRDRAFLIMDSFKEPFYNSGSAGLARACYEAICK